MVKFTRIQLKIQHYEVTAVTVTELNTTKALRPRGTKTIAKAVVDAKMKVLRIPAEHWNFFGLLLKIEGIYRLKSATQSAV